MRYILSLIVIALQAMFSGCFQGGPAGGSQPGAPYHYDSRRIYLYAVHATDPAGNLLYTDTCGLLCTCRERKGDSTQKTISWLYLATVNGRLTLNPKVVNNTYTGIISNDTTLFLHPPREDRYTILEICPYPYLLFPLAKGRTWTWDLEVGGRYSNNTVRWTDDELFSSCYTVVNDTTITIPSGRERCSHVHAHNTSRFGRSAADFFYNNEHGLIKLLYHPLDKTTVDFSFITVSSDEALISAVSPAHNNGPENLPGYKPL